jgi:histidinol dehydrogenase
LPGTRNAEAQLGRSENIGSVRLGRTTHVTVKDVVAGSFAHQPIRTAGTPRTPRRDFHHTTS